MDEAILQFEISLGPHLHMSSMSCFDPGGLQVAWIVMKSAVP